MQCTRRAALKSTNLTRCIDQPISNCIKNVRTIDTLTVTLTIKFNIISLNLSFANGLNNL